MTRLTAGCKVNLGLHVTGVRADGYHELDSLFYPRPPATIWRSAKPAGRALSSAVTSLAWTRNVIH